MLMMVIHLGREKRYFYHENKHGGVEVIMVLKNGHWELHRFYENASIRAQVDHAVTANLEMGNRENVIANIQFIETLLRNGHVDSVVDEQAIMDWLKDVKLDELKFSLGLI